MRGNVSSSSNVLISSASTTNKKEAVLEANFDVSLEKHHDWSSKITRSTEGFSGYSIVDGTVSVSAEPSYSGSGPCDRSRGTELSTSSVVRAMSVHVLQELVPKIRLQSLADL